MNYIKGYRYELYCISRSVRTPHCVVWIECEDSISSKLNDSRSDKYEEVIFNDLRLRFEAPIEKNRWDMPLYRVNMTSTISETTGILPLASPAMKVSDDSISNEDSKPTTVFSSWKKKQSSDDQSCTNTVVSTFTTKTKSSDNTLTISGSSNKIINALQGPTPSRILHQLTNNTHSRIGCSPNESFEQIKSHLSGSTNILPNASTMSVARASADQLYEIDRISQKINQLIISHQLDNVEGIQLFISSSITRSHLLTHRDTNIFS